MDILDLFKDFHERGRFGKGLNSTFLVLIPKKKGVEDLKDFRPISLIGSIYKLIAKVLANRLKKVMNGLVNPAQNAFVEGRQILDASLIANEVIDSMQKRKERGILCKLDIEKAYDQINWKFILKVLKKMGFGNKWVNWIEWCISTATFSVLVNGSPAGFFGSSRGLRQGDPLSPYLVLIPKKKGAEDLKDFRPISLIGSIYKLIAKVLANRLKKVMNGLVNPAQNAFVEGRQILDASLIANEVIDSMQKRKERGILCKLDIEKAYDQINWKFILKVLKKMGFGNKWVNWIEWCISTATFSVLVNGSPTGFFGSSRGLRQGDPLSSYLFVLGMEALSLMIDKAAE